MKLLSWIFIIKLIANSNIFTYGLDKHNNRNSVVLWKSTTIWSFCFFWFRQPNNFFWKPLLDLSFEDSKFWLELEVEIFQKSFPRFQGFKWKITHLRISSFRKFSKLQLQCDVFSNWSILNEQSFNRQFIWLNSQTCTPLGSTSDYSKARM